MTGQLRAQLLTGLLTLQLVACGGGSSSAPPPPPPPPPANLAPTFGALNFQATEDTDLAVRVPATDPEGAAVTITSTSNPAHGTLVSLASNGDLLYRPSSNYSGDETFAVRVVDPAGNAATGTVTISVAPVNDLPQAAAITLQTDEDAQVQGQVTATDVETGALVTSTNVNPANGLLQNVTAAGAFTYLPNLGFAGTDTFQLRVTDAGGATVDVPVSVTVNRTSILYSGSTAPVTITEANSPDSARSAWIALKVLVGLSETALTTAQPGGARDFTQNGDLGGSVHYVGTLLANGTGRLQADYTQYRDSSLPGITLNGREFIDILEPRTATTGQVRRLFKTLTYSAADLDGRLSGWLTRHDSAVDGPDGLTHQLFGSVVVRENAGNVYRWFTEVDLRRSPALQSYRDPNRQESTVNAWSGVFRAHDSRTGYVNVSFTPSLNFLRLSEPGPLPTGSDLSRVFGKGSMLISGATARKLWLTGLSPATFSLETNAGGGLSPDRSLAFRWEDDFTQPAGADTDHEAYAVVTRPFDINWATTNAVFWPEGRFSEHGNGQFLSHQWEMIYSPPGSTAVLNNAQSTRPSFAADVTGEYLLKLTVNDGTHSSTDYLNVEATTPDNLPTTFELLRANRIIPGANPIQAANQEFVLDARRSYATYYHDQPIQGFPPSRWRVERADHNGNVVVMTAPEGPVARFAPTQWGIYYASYEQFNGSLNVELLMEPAIRTKLVASIGMGSIPFDYDNDGDLDVLEFGPRPGGGGATYLRVLRRQPNGRLSAPQYMTSVTFLPDSWDIGFDDFNADGRPDVVRSYFGGVEVIFQQPDGSLGTVNSLGNGADQCAGGTANFKVVGAVDVDHNGRNDVIRTSWCVSGPNAGQYFMQANLSNPAGFANATLLTVPGASMVVSGDSADLDGDGVREIVGTPIASGVLPTAFIVLRPNGSGGLAASSIPLSGSYHNFGYDVRIVDINADGRLDIIGGVDDTYILTQDATHNFVERARITDSAAQQRKFYEFQTADFDGDGLQDLYLGNSQFDTIPVTWYRQLPNGGFAGQVGMTVGPISVFDANGDGYADFVTPYGSLPAGGGDYAPGAILNIQVPAR